MALSPAFAGTRSRRLWVLCRRGRGFVAARHAHLDRGNVPGFLPSPEARELDKNKPYKTVLARFESVLSRKDPEPISQRRAAVLILLLPGSDGETRVLLTQRSKNLRSHPGECALPGGSRDAEDWDDAAAAVRETWEEVGLPADAVRVLGCLPPVLSKHCLSVTPVVAALRDASWEDHELEASADEVASIFTCPLSLFLRPPTSSHLHHDVAYPPSSSDSHPDSVTRGPPGETPTFRFHTFRLGAMGQPVWGLTAYILIQAARVGFGEAPSFAVEADAAKPYWRLEFQGDARVAGEYKWGPMRGDYFNPPVE